MQISLDKEKERPINMCHISKGTVYEVIIFEIETHNKTYKPNVYLVDDCGSLIICDLSYFEIINPHFSKDFIIKSDDYFITLIHKELAYDGFLDEFHSGYNITIDKFKSIFPKISLND